MISTDIEIRGGNISVNGTVEGNSILVANAIELGTEATFKKNVKYWKWKQKSTSL